MENSSLMGLLVFFGIFMVVMWIILLGLAYGEGNKRQIGGNNALFISFFLGIIGYALVVISPLNTENKQ